LAFLEQTNLTCRHGFSFCRIFLLIFHIRLCERLYSRQNGQLVFKLKGAAFPSSYNGNISVNHIDYSSLSYHTGSAQTAAICNGQAATIVGSPGSDDMNGTPGRDMIATLRGHDNVRAQGGNDLICGGLGNDDICGMLETM